MMKFNDQHRYYLVGADLSCTLPIYRPEKRIDELLADTSTKCQSIVRLRDYYRFRLLMFII